MQEKELNIEIKTRIFPRFLFANLDNFITKLNIKILIIGLIFK